MAGKNVIKRMQDENFRINRHDPDTAKGKGCCDPLLAQFLGGNGTPEEVGVESIRGYTTVYLDSDTGDLYTDTDGTLPFTVIGSLFGGGGNTIYSADDVLTGDRLVDTGGNVLQFGDALPVNGDGGLFVGLSLGGVINQVTGASQPGRNPALTGYMVMGDYSGIAQGQDQLFLGWTDQGAGTENQAFSILDCNASGDGYYGVSAWSKLAGDADFNVLVDSTRGTGVSNIQLYANSGNISQVNLQAEDPVNNNRIVIYSTDVSGRHIQMFATGHDIYAQADNFDLELSGNVRIGGALGVNDYTLPNTRGGAGNEVLTFTALGVGSFDTVPNILGGIQGAPTAQDGGAINSGDVTTDGVIANNRTRIQEVITALQNLGLMNV